ncbi:sigma 54-interacting transcriptional regulator [Desulfosporosinus sp. SYSU MS00001]|uniref:sigma 54-interacting transcriptional regulator n=1 Tax=Desulfosporosinus sp. SYSU MS00001 TaxID=3416284 RepID=UPI003CF5B6A3
MDNKSDLDQLNLALIASYPKLSKVFEKTAKREDIKYVNLCAAFEEAANLAKEIEPKVDAILSRGGTAEYIRQVVDIPVISIPITQFNIVRSMYQVPKEVNDIAFFNYGRNIYGIRDIEAMFNKTLHEYIYLNRQDIIKAVSDVKERGLKVIIGGNVAVQLAQKEGLEGIEVGSGEETVYRSILETKHVVQVHRLVRNQAIRLNAVLNSIAEGIIVTDEQNRIVTFNPSAERIFRLPKEDALGKQVLDIVPNTGIPNVYKNGEPEIAYLQKINGGIITATRQPIFLDDKPVGVVSTFQDVTKVQNLEQQIRKRIYHKGFIAKHYFDDILTNNPNMLELKEMAALYATTQSSVLIEGESGTGKELFAQSIHNSSQRASGPFIAVNCAAIPEHLLESELFGYEGGAFTGAKKEGKQGLFELAHNGTIFLDEIGEIPKSLQARLLRVLQEKEIMHIGGDKIIPVDIRIISATNKNLEEKVKHEEFRNDLYYRLKVFGIKLPPLRERKEDIPLLTGVFFQKFSKELDAKTVNELLPLLLEYTWPGNIRELRNVIEQLSLLVDHFKNTPSWVGILNKVLNKESRKDNGTLSLQVNLDNGLKDALDQAEKQIIDLMLAQYANDRNLAAQKLGIGRTTLWRKRNEFKD